MNLIYLIIDKQLAIFAKNIDKLIRNLQMVLKTLIPIRLQCKSKYIFRNMMYIIFNIIFLRLYIVMIIII